VKPEEFALEVELQRSSQILARGLYPGVTKEKRARTLKALAKAVRDPGQRFQRLQALLMDVPRVSLRSNPELALVNAFGASKVQKLQIGGAKSYLLSPNE
jgi:hypothetical protein